MRILPCGDQAILLDCDSPEEAIGWSLALADLDPVAGARTVLLRGSPPELRSTVAARRPSEPATADPQSEIVISVTYDGPDLARVAQATGLTAAEVVAAHVGWPWTVAFVGFAPGFAYLTGGDPRLCVARHETPRSSVPSGSVGLAGEFSGIYPRSSPGGWQLIGRTDLNLFTVDRDPPALLQPGRRVRFEATP